MSETEALVFYEKQGNNLDVKNVGAQKGRSEENDA